MSDRERAKEIRRQIFAIHEKYVQLMREETKLLEEELIEIMSRNTPRIMFVGEQIVIKQIWDD
jgi:hypothetical protein